MTAEDISLLTRVLIAYQGALLDNVTPNLRAATVRVDYPVITSRVFYRSLDEAEREIAELIETYVIADFPAPMNSDFTIIELQDEPLPELRPGEKWVFLTHEPSADETW